MEDITWVAQEWSQLGVLFLPAFRRQGQEDSQLLPITALCGTAIKILNLWWHFLLFLLISPIMTWNTFKKLLTVFKDILHHIIVPTYEPLTLADPRLLQILYPKHRTSLLGLLHLCHLKLSSPCDLQQTVTLLMSTFRLWLFSIETVSPLKEMSVHTSFTEEQLLMPFRAASIGSGGEGSHSQVENPCSRDNITVTYKCYKHRQQNTLPSPLFSIQKRSSKFPLNWMTYLRTGGYLYAFL